MALKIKPYDLIITHLHIAEDSGSTLVENDQLGLELLTRAIGLRGHISGVLISPVINKELREAVKSLLLSTVRRGI